MNFCDNGHVVTAMNVDLSRVPTYWRAKLRLQKDQEMLLHCRIGLGYESHQISLASSILSDYMFIVTHFQMFFTTNICSEGSSLLTALPLIKKKNKKIKKATTTKKKNIRCKRTTT